MFEAVPEERTLSIMPTWQCTAACQHCGTLSSPKVKTSLALEHIFKAIDEAYQEGYKVVVFTGGEATLAMDNLLLGIRRAISHGMIVRLVTNAYWANTEEIADVYINKFKNAGLKEINFSTGDQHTRFVKIENVIRAARASVKAKLTVAIMVENVKDRKINKVILEQHPDYIKIFKDFKDAFIRINESPWMPLSPTEKNEYTDNLTANSNNISCRQGCDNILTTTTIEADGSIAACCGIGMRLIPELKVGKIHDTKLKDAELNAKNDFLKHWIRVEGPEKILAWASSKDPSIKWENMYAHRCQACIRLYTDEKVRKVIREYHREKIADVIFGKWLINNYSPNVS